MVMYLTYGRVPQTWGVYLKHGRGVYLKHGREPQARACTSYTGVHLIHRRAPHIQPIFV